LGAGVWGTEGQSRTVLAPVADPDLIRRLDVGQAAYLYRGGVTYVQVKRLIGRPAALPPGLGPRPAQPATTSGTRPAWLHPDQATGAAVAGAGPPHPNPAGLVAADESGRFPGPDPVGPATAVEPGSPGTASVRTGVAAFLDAAFGPEDPP
jgi:hypothetical protein